MHSFSIQASHSVFFIVRRLVIPHVLAHITFNIILISESFLQDRHHFRTTVYPTDGGTRAVSTKTCEGGGGGNGCKGGVMGRLKGVTDEGLVTVLKEMATMSSCHAVEFSFFFGKYHSSASGTGSFAEIFACFHVGSAGIDG
jgi:hypothetical protein